MTPPLAVAVGGWALVALLLAVFAVAAVVGYRQLPDTPAARRRFWLVLGLLVVAPTAAFAVVATLVVTQGIPAPDLSILQFVARHQRPAATEFAQAFTDFGAVPAVLVLLAVAAGLLWRTGLPRRAAFVVAATLLAMTASGLMKVAFARPRPAVFVRAPGLWSFPSGHTMSATGFAAALVIALWATRWRLPALVAAALYAVGVGLTRVYLGYHFPSDVVGGWALALAAVGAAWLAFGLRLGRPDARRSHASLSDEDAVDRLC